jgi:[ribosomal protein S5]-alanine N-acetyltransferase
MDDLKSRMKKVIDEPVLTGDAIYLEGLSEQHISQRYTDWLNDKEVCRDNMHGLGDNTIEKTRKYVEDVDRSDKKAVFAIITKDGNRHVGNISLLISWENNSGEISIIIGEKDVWGKGIGLEAYKLLTEYAFKTLGLHRVHSGMTSRNKAMIRVAEKNGMVFEGLSKEAFLKNGEYFDIFQYAKLNRVNKK